MPDATPTSGKALRIALAAVIRPHSGGLQVLICRRHAAAVRGGLWEFPGGKFHLGEGAQQAAARELREETGLIVNPDHGRLVVELTHEEPDAPAEQHLHLTLVTFHAPVAVEPRPLGCAECKWEKLEALERYEWPKANADLIAAFKEWLGDSANPAS